jgi:hypothetical protein
MCEWVTLCVPKIMVGFQARTLTGPDTPGFLFQEICDANHVQCSYSKHSTPETANQEAAASVTAAVLGRVWQEMEYRLDVYRATSGAHTKLQ